MPKAIESVLTAIVTPFITTGGLNIPALKVQMNRRLETDSAIFCGGTNSEFFILNEQKKPSVMRAYMDEVAGHVPIVAHIGEISMRKTIRLSQQIGKLDVDAVSVIAPYFVPLKQKELIAHYSAIADVLSVPMFLCNIPTHTSNTIQPETAHALASHPSIIGIKDNVGNDESLRGLFDAVRSINDFNVLNGPDSLIRKGFVEGCSARISRFADIAPRGISTIQSRFRAGDTGGSYEAQGSVTSLHTDLYKVAFSPAAVKKASRLMGHDAGDSRYAVNFMSEQISEIQQITRHRSIN